MTERVFWKWLMKETTWKLKKPDDSLWWPSNKTSRTECLLGSSRVSETNNWSSKNAFSKCRKMQHLQLGSTTAPALKTGSRNWISTSLSIDLINSSSIGRQICAETWCKCSIMNLTITSWQSRLLQPRDWNLVLTAKSTVSPQAREKADALVA